MPHLLVLCQLYQDTILELHNMTTPWPFSMWGIDVVGPMPQKVSNGHQYIIVAMDYFIEWVEVASLSTATMKNTTRFTRKDIIY